MAKPPFEVPWTINDEDESGFGLWYLTRQEFGLVVASVMVFYCIFIPVFDVALAHVKIANVAHLLVSAACTLWFVTWMTNYKTGKPSSWLWDLMHGLGLRPQSRGIIKSHHGIRWLSMAHIAMPSIYLSGARKAGEDLTVSSPWKTTTPPICDLAPLVPPRRKRIYSRSPSPAPIWFHGANGFKDTVNPTLPITIKYALVEERVPKLEHEG